MIKTKSKLLSLLVVLFLALPLLFMMTACGEKHDHEYEGMAYVVEGDKAYIVKTCDCDKEQKTEIESAVVANTTNVEEKIASAADGSTVILSKGQYSLIELKGVDSFNDNITLIAEKEAVVDGLLITSGLTKAEYATESSVMSDNLKISNIHFKDDIQLRNCTISGLTIKDCVFTEEARIDMRANGFTAGYATHINAKDGDMIKFGWDDIASADGSNSITNVTIENNTFEGDHDTLLDDTTVIYLSGVNGATVKNNVIDDAEFNGIQITAGSSYYSRGKILVEGNTIKSSGSRSMRFSYFDDSAELIVKNNVLSDANTNPAEANENNGEVIKSSGTGTARIVFEGNTYNGEDISVGNGIRKAA